MGIGPAGTLTATVGSNSVFLKVQILLNTKPPSIKIEDVHTEYIK
jgi:hypothetical protein